MPSAGSRRSSKRALSMEKHQPGLEVSPHDAPEVYIREEQPLYVPNHSPPNFPGQLDTAYQASGPSQQTSPSSNNPGAREKTICGLRASRFWIITAIAALTVVAAVVGGSVGGVLAARGSGSDT